MDKKAQLLDEIYIYINFAVPEDERDQAKSFARRFQDNLLLVRLLHEHYVALPDALEEAVVRISRLIQRQGVGLFVLTTKSMSFLYAASDERVFCLGEYSTEPNQELIECLGIESVKELKKILLPVDKLPECTGDSSKDKALCPACGVEEGELHLLGCSVEVCPWCNGQLCRCNCRFEQLETESIDSEEQLDEFYELLNEKGRVPFAGDQSPSYPGTVKGLDK
jgi:hypothetical protein